MHNSTIELYEGPASSLNAFSTGSYNVDVAWKK